MVWSSSTFFDLGEYQRYNQQIYLIFLKECSHIPIEIVERILSYTYFDEEEIRFLPIYMMACQPHIHMDQPHAYGRLYGEAIELEWKLYRPVGLREFLIQWIVGNPACRVDLSFSSHFYETYNLVDWVECLFGLSSHYSFHHHICSLSLHKTICWKNFFLQPWEERQEFVCRRYSSLWFNNPYLQRIKRLSSLLYENDDIPFLSTDI